MSDLCTIPFHSNKGKKIQLQLRNKWKLRLKSHSSFYSSLSPLLPPSDDNIKNATEKNCGANKVQLKEGDDDICWQPANFITTMERNNFFLRILKKNYEISSKPICCVTSTVRHWSYQINFHQQFFRVKGNKDCNLIKLIYQKHGTFDIPYINHSWLFNSEIAAFHMKT